MLRAKGHIRESVIPDIQVKILELCLSDNENGILTPCTQRATIAMDFRADWALQEVISTKIKNHQRAIPLTLRKKQLYQNVLNRAKENDLIEKLSQYKTLPITMRKYILYQDCRAG